MTWEPDKHSGLSERLGCRVAMAMQGKRETGLSMRQIRRVAFDNLRGTYSPKWIRDLDVDFYDDTWTDWEADEIKLLADRIRAGCEPEAVRLLFDVPQSVMLGLPRAKAAPEPIVVEEDVADEFTESDIADPEARQRANNEFQEYARGLEMRYPANRITVRSLIVIGVQMKRVEQELMVKAIATEKLATLLDAYKSLSNQYSSAAEDVAQLERQRESRDVAHTFSMLIEKESLVNREWQKNKTREHQRLEETTLIEHMVKLHKIDMQDSNLSAPERSGNIDKRSQALPPGVTVEEVKQTRAEKQNTTGSIAVTAN